jgi:hypothetical protein
MRTVPTQVGAATGNHRGTKGMPEVQEPVLEHAPTETREEEITRDGDVVNLVTSVTEIRKTDEDDLLVAARKRLNHGHFIVRNLGTPQEVWAVPTVLLFPSDRAPARPS